MITKLVLNNTAIYTQKVEIEPTEINYFYGNPNTISTIQSQNRTDLQN